jgi:chromosome segregation ATPase
MAPDLAQSIQMMARELAYLEQGIDQLKTGQAQMVRENGELTEHLKAMQEMAHHSTDLAEDLKAARAQMARDNVNFVETLTASQEQIANIAGQLKESQEQIARPVASEQRQRPRTPASSPLPIPSTARKPVPTTPQIRLQTQYPTHLQPKQQ